MRLDSLIPTHDENRSFIRHEARKRHAVFFVIESNFFLYKKLDSIKLIQVNPMHTNNHFGYMKIHFIDSNNLSVATVHVITHNFQ